MSCCWAHRLLSGSSADGCGRECSVSASSSCSLAPSSTFCSPHRTSPLGNRCPLVLCRCPAGCPCCQHDQQSDRATRTITQRRYSTFPFEPLEAFHASPMATLRKVPVMALLMMEALPAFAADTNGGAQRTCCPNFMARAIGAFEKLRCVLFPGAYSR
eukprot:739134-Pleurochrysis_carterae.AAC.2